MVIIKATAEEAIVTLTGQDFISGLSPNGTFGVSNLFPQMSAEGASNLQNINPFTTYGVLQPGHDATNVTNNSVLGGVVQAGIIQGQTYAYLVDGGGYLHQYNYTIY